MGMLEKCGCKWKGSEECLKSMNCFSKCIDKEPYTDYSFSEKKIAAFEQKINQLEQYCTVMDENNKRLHNKCVQLEERDNNRERNIQKIVLDMDIITKSIESLEQRVSTIHLDKSDNVENEFIVIA